jgi:Skp family chaperone for outer membrane proteins
MRASGLAGALALCALLAGPGMAQDLGVVQSDILVLDTERLFNSTLIGARLTAEYQTERDKLIASNREIEAELRTEEQDLTERRKTMTPAEFRDAADAFDARVRDIRQENERAVRDLERARELAPLTMMRLAEPVLVQLMRDAGGRIVIDHRQVLLRADTIDITDLAIARLDEVIGDGAAIEAAQEPPAPDDAPAGPAPTPEAAPEAPTERPAATAPEVPAETPPAASPEAPAQ